MPQVSFFDFLRASLCCIAAEEPRAHQALARTMQSLRARLIADGLARTVWFDGSEWVIDVTAEGHVSIGFDRALVLDVVYTGLTMAEAVEQERLRIEGPVQAVERLNDVLSIYLEGFIRAPGASELLDGYRKLV